MAQVDLTPVYQALREADAAGDEQEVKRLLAYIDEQEKIAQSDIPQPSGSSVRAPQKPVDLPTRVAQAGGVLARGVLGMPAMVTQAAQEAWNLTTPLQALAANALGYDRVTPEMLQFAPENMALTDLQRVTTRAGEPTGGRIVEGAIGALTGAGTARSAAAVAKSPVTRTLAETLGKNRVLQGISGAGAGAGVEAAKAADLGPIGQLVAGVAGAAAPAAAIQGTRAALVPAGVDLGARQRQFARAGVETPTLGQLTQGRGVQQVESLAGKGIGGYGHREAVRESQQAGMGAKVDEIADRLGNVHSGEEAGRIIERGLTGEGGFTQRFQAAQEVAYGKLDSLVPADMPVVPQNTRKTLSVLAAPIKGATATTGGLVNPKIKALRESIEADLAANAATDATGAAKVPGIPYAALAKIRSRVGEMLGEDEMVSGASRAQLKRVYAALSEDMKVAVNSTGNPRAIEAFNRASALTRAGHNRIDSVLQSLMDKKVPEMVYKSATNIADMKAGASKIRTVLKSLRPEEADAVRGMFLRQIGRANPAKQNADGDVFSSETFLTNWSKLSPEAKTALYGKGDLRRNLDEIAQTADAIRSSTAVLDNPSGTAAVGGAIGTATGITGTLAAGYPMAAAGLAAVPAVSYATSRLMTSPKFIGWLAKEMKGSGGAPSQASLQALADIMKGEPASVRDDTDAYIQQMQQAE